MKLNQKLIVGSKDKDKNKDKNRNRNKNKNKIKKHMRKCFNNIKKLKYKRKIQIDNSYLAIRISK